MSVLSSSSFRVVMHICSYEVMTIFFFARGGVWGGGGRGDNNHAQCVGWLDMKHL